jgi:hypothetical protein
MMSMSSLRVPGVARQGGHYRWSRTGQDQVKTEALLRAYGRFIASLGGR